MRKISLFVFVISVANVHAMQKKRKKDSLACQSLRHGSRIHTAVQSYSFLTQCQQARSALKLEAECESSQNVMVL